MSPRPTVLASTPLDGGTSTATTPTSTAGQQLCLFGVELTSTDRWLIDSVKAVRPNRQVIWETFFLAISTEGTNHNTTKADNTRTKSYKLRQTRMRADAQRDDRPTEYRWRPLLNAAQFG